MLVLVRTVYAAILMLFAGLALADVQVVEPETGDKFSGDSGTVSINLKWVDNSAYPPVDKVTYFTFTLQTGPNDDIEKVKVLKQKVSLSEITQENDEYSYKLEFDSSITGNGQYYIQVFSYIEDKGNTNNYSPRFQLTSMGGSSSATYSDSTQPNGETKAWEKATTTQGTIDTHSFTVPYTAQTGISRFAPMQLQPVTKITASTWTRKFATSAVTYYSTYRNTLAQETTITPGWSYTLPSGVNMATPAPYPTSNGGWHDPKERQSLSTRKVNLKKRAQVMDF